MPAGRILSIIGRAPLGAALATGQQQGLTWPSHPGRSDTRPIRGGAQDVQPLFPSLVTPGQEVWTLNYSGIGVVAVAALQELKREKDAEIETLRRANAELTARLARLESLLEPRGNN